MKTTGFRLLQLGTPWRNLSYIIVETDEGITGIGEARVLGKTHTVAEYLKDVERHFIGHDPFDIESLYRRFTLLDFGKAGEVVHTGLAMVEMAFWDAKGKELNKPLIIHCRDSFSDVFDTLSTRETTNPIILHSWTGGNKWTKKFIDLGVYFSISGIVTYDTAHDLQAAVKNIPIDKILLETDVPYLAPQPFKGKRNNPTYIKFTGGKLAELLGVTPNELSKITITNTNKVMNRET